jgi:hypothetical protein
VQLEPSLREPSSVIVVRSEDGRKKTRTIVTAGAFLGSSKSLLASMAKSDSAIESSIVAPAIGLVCITVFSQQSWMGKLSDGSFTLVACGRWA